MLTNLREPSFNFRLQLYCTVHGLWFQGSPSICMGNCFLVLITTWLHCASRLPLDRSPVRTWTNQR